MSQKRQEENSNKRNDKKAVGCQFTMLPEESKLIDDLKVRYQKEALSVSDKPADIARSEIVRAGIQALIKMPSKSLYKIIEKLEKFKEGRPKKEANG